MILHLVAVRRARFEIFDGEDIVGRFDEVGVIGVDEVERHGAGLCNGIAFRKIAPQHVAHVLGLAAHELRDIGKLLELLGLGAEAEDELAEHGEGLQSALGKGLRGGEGVDGGELDDKVRPALDSPFSAGIFVRDADVAALGERAAHHDDEGFGLDLPLHFFEKFEMTVVERIVFGNDRRDFHKLPPSISCFFAALVL